LAFGRHLKRTNNSASDTFHVSAAAVLDGCDALYVIRSNSHQPISILVSTGTRLPAHVTAMGRVLLASLVLKRIAELLRQAKFNRLKEKSVIDVVQLREFLAQVRQQGTRSSTRK
jgi:IclR family pca regulon transcriptional regulator